MNGEWVHDNQRDTWHLVWQVRETEKDSVIDTWCHLELPWDAPTKPGADIDWTNILHDECIRESER